MRYSNERYTLEFHCSRQPLQSKFPDEWRKAISDYDGVINIEAK